MDSLAGYGSEEENDTTFRPNQNSGAGGSSKRRADDYDTNYDDVNMDMSEGSESESEPELPPADAEPSKPQGHSKNNDYQNDKDRPPRNDREDRDRRRYDNDRRDNRNDDRPRYDRDRDRRDDHGPRKGLLGDRPDDIKSMDRRTSSSGSETQTKSYDARDAVSPRFVDRDRRDRDRDNYRDRDRSSRDRPRDRGDERRHRYNDRRSRSRERSDRSKSRGYPPPESTSERRTSPSNEYRPSYKVNKKLQVMEKMGLQIKTPDGSMTTAQQLRQAASEVTPSSSGLFSGSGPAAKVLDQVNKRKLLWANKAKSEPEEAAKWSGTKFAQDTDGKQTSKFMRLMGIKDGAPAPTESKSADPIKKQEEMFQAMQAQYEVARATTHTMRGVGLGFQRGPL